MMVLYQNLNGDSGVVSSEMAEDPIHVVFRVEPAATICTTPYARAGGGGEDEGPGGAGLLP